MSGDVPSNDSLHIATRLAQGGHFVDGATGAIVPPIQSSTTFARDESYALPSEFSYARADNPNAHLLERRWQIWKVVRIRSYSVPAWRASVRCWKACQGKRHCCAGCHVSRDTRLDASHSRPAWGNPGLV